MVDACPVLYNLHLTACFCTTFIGLFAFPLHTASSNVEFVKTDLFSVFTIYYTQNNLAEAQKSRNFTQNKGVFGTVTNTNHFWYFRESWQVCSRCGLIA